jgi:hypothetical protein
MAEMDIARHLLTRPLPVAAEASPLVRRMRGRLLDWEAWLTLGLAAAAVLTVTLSLEEAGWTDDMPAITLVAILALATGLGLARARLPALAAWPLAVLMGAMVTFWQTMVMVGPGGLETRADAIYFRFRTWFHVAFTGGITNDPLPFNVLVIGLTWIGVFLFAWALWRWHNAWLGLIPGGAALFLNLVFVGEDLQLGVLLYVLIGFMLLMRSNLVARMTRWKVDGVSYPPLISFTFLHYTFWATLALVTAAWLSPVGPFSTPGAVDAAVRRLEGVGIHFVRLAGPLHVKKVIPVHSYTGALPFQGTIDLRERELLTVTMGDLSIEGPITLRGAVYDEYSPGGWQAGDREEVEPPTLAEIRIQEQIQSGELAGRLLPVTIELETRSVVGTVLFSPGQIVSAQDAVKIEVPGRDVHSLPVGMAGGGRDLTDEKVLNAAVPENAIGLSVNRDGEGRVQSIEVLDTRTREWG